MTGAEHPTRLEIAAARAQVALDRRARRPSPDWLLRLAATEIPDVPTTVAQSSTGATLLPSATRARRALAWLPARPMQGRDVLDLQRRLVALGYARDDLIDGIFGETTEIAVRRFQNAFDILNDGVYGRVSQRVLDYLESNGIDKDNQPTVQQLHLISFIVKTQQGGFVVIDLVSRSPVAGADAILQARLIDEVGHRLEATIGVLTGMQSWVFTTANMAREEEQIASFANNIKAELLITLSVGNDAGAGPGCATWYFGSAPDVYSHVGRPLAEAVQTEVVRIAKAPDRGTHPEYSQLFEQAKAPTVRVELGNLADPADRTRLADEAYQDRIATGIAAGIKRFYRLGEEDDEPASLNLGATSGR
jgi:peptidoglycan hydrolase-like protein with peptidoglycan-binding domain